MDTFSKTESEILPLAFEFKEKLPAGYNLASGTLSAVDTADNSDQTANVLTSANAIIAGTQARFTVRGGVYPHQYHIMLLAPLSSGGGVLQEDVLMIIDNG